MPHIEPRRQFVPCTESDIFDRKLIKPKRTALLIFLDPHPKIAYRQLSFNWRGLVENVLVLTNGNPKLDRVGITRQITNVGVGKPPYNCRVDPSPHTEVNDQLIWIAKCLKGCVIDNIIISTTKELDRTFFARANMILSRQNDGRYLNFYRAADIERARS